MPVPIVPTEAYFSGNVDSVLTGQSTERYTVFIQGSHSRRDSGLLLDVWRHPLFVDHQLSNHFDFQWRGKALPSTASYDALIEFLARNNGSDRVQYDAGDIENDDEYQRSFSSVHSSHSIFFSLTSSSGGHILAEYLSGFRFTSTFIYSISLNKPVTVYRDLYDLWRDHYGSDEMGFVRYENVDELVHVLVQMVEDDNYYRNLCENAVKFRERLKAENMNNIHRLLVRKKRLNK